MTLEIYLNSVNTYNRIECIIISNKLSFNIHEEDIPSIIP